MLQLCKKIHKVSRYRLRYLQVWTETSAVFRAWFTLGFGFGFLVEVLGAPVVCRRCPIFCGFGSVMPTVLSALTTERVTERKREIFQYSISIDLELMNVMYLRHSPRLGMNSLGFKMKCIRSRGKPSCSSAFARNRVWRTIFDWL